MKYADDPQYRKLVLWLAKPIREQMEADLERGIIRKDYYNIKWEDQDGFDKYDKIARKMDKKKRLDWVAMDVKNSLIFLHISLDDMARMRRKNKNKTLQRLFQFCKKHLWRLACFTSGGQWYIEANIGIIRAGYKKNIKGPSENLKNRRHDQHKR